VCGVGVRKTRQVLFSPDAIPKGFLPKSGKQFRTYGDLTVLKMAAVRQLGFSKIRNFNCRSPACQYTSPYQISLKAVKRLRIYGDKTFFPKWRPSVILGLLGAYLDHPR